VRIATCQFPVSQAIARNCAYMLRQIEHAAKHNADLVHFGECALSGYCGVDFKDWAGYDWELLHSCTEKILAAAKDWGVWVAFGCCHRLSGDHLPHNCIYVVDKHGQLVTRYDKRRCSVKDLNNYTPGTVPICFEVDGVKFGLLICLDYRFPELYREYMDLGVDCILHSFHDAGKQEQALSTMIAPPTLQGQAGNYVMWLSVANNCARYQAFSSIFLAPTGEVLARAKRHQAEVLVNELDLAGQQAYINMVRSFRSAARSGTIYQPRLATDPRTNERTRL
jgi:deaminated glutathione amidase